MTDIDPKTLDKLSKLIPRLASDHSGEVVATVAAIQRTLASAGASFHDLVSLLKRKPVERVVYRDKIVVKERVVYRDPPPPPRTDSSRSPMVAEEALTLCARLLVVNDLNDKGRAFVEFVQKRAKRGDEHFSLTVKQDVWLTALADRHAPD